ncbi:response regulator [Opitutus sp. ER46]|uniref:response regulator n=1 Tax=Opitutus sp. ER46 TaxID=2161864 RepID=UPI000D3050CE|nr:response regulator [Opitutus sp. ER46]PTX90704.1 hypothetical protein DB354_18755 [Opitutus sp. ER46]
MAKILAIDDSLTIRKLVGMVLRGAGHEVLLAEKGATGLELAQSEHPELILLDYVLPDMQSPVICQRLLEDPTTADIPVLLISTNGGAIRQLYADSRNVRDYLTKPFQAKVLESVVEHLLTKKPSGAAGESEAAAVLPTGSNAPVPALTASGSTPPAPVVGVVVPFADPEPAGAQPVPPARAEPASVPPPPARFGPGVASAMANDGHAGLRTLLNARFRAIARMLPELETRRGPLPAETYYLPFLLRNELVSEIVAEVSRTQISADQAMPLIAGTHEWMGIDTTFFHLGRTLATGVFSLRLPQETVDVTLLRGQVVMVGSNNPRVYCAGATYNFRSAPPPAIAAAVAAQQRDGTPFFVTLARLGALRDAAVLAALLRTQGVRAVHRAMVTPGTRYAFLPRENLPEFTRQFALNLDVRQFVLEVLRGVDDWLEIESTTGSVETIFARDGAAEMILPLLSLTPEESAVVAAVDGRLALQELAARAGLDLFGSCAIAYRLLKLGIIRVAASAAPAAPFCDPSVEEFLQGTAAEAWSPPPSTPRSRHPLSSQD